MHRAIKIIQKYYSNRTWFKSSKNTVFLTFDDGPCPDLTEWILEVLKVESVSATFFCVGENVLRYPALFTRIKAEGHRVGNHMMKHENGFKTPRVNYYKSFLKGQEIVGSNLFRPPYGRMRRTLDQKVRTQAEIVMWTWLSKDYDTTVSPKKILQAATKIRPGDILVFHDNVKAEKNLKATLVPVIHLLKQKGFTFSVL